MSRVRLDRVPIEYKGDEIECYECGKLLKVGVRSFQDDVGHAFCSRKCADWWHETNREFQAGR